MPKEQIGDQLKTVGEITSRLKESRLVFTRTRRFLSYIFLPFGAVAQLIERVVRNDEVVGLIPICSTKFWENV
jgi:hypothetical protein